jgi:hypothetical protein
MKQAKNVERINPNTLYCLWCRRAGPLHWNGCFEEQCTGPNSCPGPERRVRWVVYVPASIQRAAPCPPRVHAIWSASFWPAECTAMLVVELETTCTVNQWCIQAIRTHGPLYSSSIRPGQKILSSILNSSALIHPLYHPLFTLFTVGPTCHFI